MNYKRRFAMTAASSTLLLLAQAQAAQDEPLEQVVVTGTRVANRSALDTAVPVDVVSGEQLQNGGITEVNQALVGRAAFVQFSAAGSGRWHRHDPSRDAARTCA